MSGGQLQALPLPFPPRHAPSLPTGDGSGLHGVRRHGTGSVSQLFEARLAVVSSGRGIDPNTPACQPVGSAMREQPHGDRFIDGLVAPARVSAAPCAPPERKAV